MSLNRPNRPRRNQRPGWQQRGFDSRAAQQSVFNQYGAWNKTDGVLSPVNMDFFTRQMEHAGYGPEFQAQSLNEVGTPVSIGGARWMMGKNGLQFTGQASDVPFGNQPVGAAYNAPAGQQVSYGGVSGQGGGRPNPRPPNSQGGLPNQGVPRRVPRPTNFQNWQDPRQERWLAQNRPGGAGGQGGQGPGGGSNNGGGAGSVEPGGPAVGSFLPLTPEYVAAQRSAEDQLASQLADINYQRAQIPGTVNMFGARQATDLGYDTDRLNEQTAERGIFGSGAADYLRGRDITTPYSREQQDFQLQMQQLAQELGLAEGQAGLGYNQTLMEAMLNRGSQLAEEQPLSIPGLYGPRRNPRRNRNRPRRRPRNRGNK